MTSLSVIESATCRACGVSLDAIRGHCRYREYVRARQIRALLARRLGRWSFPELAEAWGQAHHTSVLGQYKAAMRNRLLPEWACLFERALELCEGWGRGLNAPQSLVPSAHGPCHQHGGPGR